MFYFVKTPHWVMKWFSKCVWEIPSHEKVIYLTFDDGPHPEATSFVLDTLKEYGAKATFFCIGKNVIDQPVLYERIITEEHAVGNHTFNHLNGWKTTDSVYMEDIAKAKKYIDSSLFRPPYGKIRLSQSKKLRELGYKIILWTWMSYDFDKSLSAREIISKSRKIKGGDILVFHDNVKANERTKEVLPSLINSIIKQGYRFKTLA